MCPLLDRGLSSFGVSISEVSLQVSVGEEGLEFEYISGSDMSISNLAKSVSSYNPCYEVAYGMSLYELL